MRSDRELLLGLLALQNSFITKDQLIAAFSVWTSDKSKSLESILTSENALNPDHRALLVALVEVHLKQHDNDPEKSLASIGSLPSIKSDLENIADTELLATLMHVPSKTRSPSLTPHDPFVTVSTQTFHRETSRFRILRPHAAGGLGQVSVAMDEELKREVAFKEIKSQFADHTESRQRFVREAEITGALEHPSIVPVYGLGTYGDGRPFYAMRFIKGDSLKDWITQFHKKKAEMQAGEKTLALRQLLSRFIDVCQAMHYAHSRGVLHRDLKPHNVMLGKYGETLVVDWGLAKTLGEKTKNYSPESTALVTPNLSGSHEVTTQGSAIGTPAYMSPEQAEGKIDELGPASDIYSLGVTLYHCLTGTVPFEQKNYAVVLEAVKKGECRRPREIDASIPKSLEAICQKAMQLNAKDRYATAQALADDIEHFLADEPVTAHRESPAERVTRFGRKHKSATMTALGSLAVIALLLAGGIWIVAGQREAARQLAQKNQSLASEKSTLAQQQTKLAEERGELLKKNEEQSKSLLREFAKSEFALAVSSHESRSRDESARHFLKATALSKNSPRLREAYVSTALDRLTAAGACRLPPLKLAGPATQIGFSPDGKRMAVVFTPYERDYDALKTRIGADTFQLCDAETAKPIGKSIVSSPEGFAPLAFSPDLRFVAIPVRGESGTKALQILNSETGEPIGKSLYHPETIEKVDGNSRFTTNNEVSRITFSPNGKQVAAASRDNTVRIWDVETGEPIGKGLVHQTPVTEIAFSLDGRRIATGSEDGIAFWDVETGERVGKSLGIVDTIFSCLVFSPDGRRVAARHKEDPTARVSAGLMWDVETGVPVGNRLEHEGSITHIAFSPDGSRIATASFDATARIWNAETGEPIGGSLVHQRELSHVAFSPDGRRIATASADGTARIWNAETGKPISGSLVHRGGVNLVAFSPNGRRIATASGEETAIWDVAILMPNGKSLVRQDLIRRGDRRGSLGWISVSSDGRRVVVSDDKTTRILDSESGEPVGKSLSHETSIIEIALGPDGKRVATASKDKITRIWNTESGNLIGKSPVLPHEIRRILFSADGKRLAIVSPARPASPPPPAAPLAPAPDAPAPQAPPAPAPPFPNFPSAPQPAAAPIPPVPDAPPAPQAPPAPAPSFPNFPPPAPQAAAAPIPLVPEAPPATQAPSARSFTDSPTGDSTILILNAETGEQVGQSLVQHAYIRFVAFSSDGKRIATIADDQFLRIYDTEAGELIEKNRDGASFPGFTSAFFEFYADPAFSPDGKRVATALADGSVKIWDAKTGESVGKSFVHQGEVACITYSPDGKRIATSSADGTARVWDAETGEPVGKSLVHKDAVTYVGFSLDGKHIATSSVDGTARVWDAETGEPVGGSLVHNAIELGEVVFTPDARRVVTISVEEDESGLIARSWDIAPPIPGNLEAYLELLAGYKSDDAGEPIQLTQEETTARDRKLFQDRQWLDAMGSDLAKRGEQFSRASLDDAERDHHHFAAVFHLKQLLKTHLEDADLKSRLATAEKYLPHWRLDFDAHKAETNADWKFAIPLLDDLAKHYPSDESITARLQKAKAEAAKLENQNPQPQADSK